MAPENLSKPRFASRQESISGTFPEKLPGAGTLPGTLPGVLPGAGLPTPQQQLEALQRVQSQAEQRVKLGLQFFKAAEAQTAEQRKLVDQLHVERDRLRQEVQEDVTKSLHAYDQWVGQIDESFTRGLRTLEGKMDRLEEQWAASQQRIESMLKRSESMLTQTRTLLDKIEAPSEGPESQDTSESRSTPAASQAPAAPLSRAAPSSPAPAIYPSTFSSYGSGACPASSDHGDDSLALAPALPKIAPLIRDLMAQSAAGLTAAPIEVHVEVEPASPPPTADTPADQDKIYTQAVQMLDRVAPHHQLKHTDPNAA